MIPLIDIHVHLLAGLDDGPKTMQDAIAMLRMMVDEGIQVAAATAHQNDEYPKVTPERIHEATRKLSQAIRGAKLPITVVPNAEVMAELETPTRWENDELVSIADRKEYMLLEAPHGLFVDLLPTVEQLREKGIRPVLAHPERQPELLEQPERIEELIRAGCLVQVSSGSITKVTNRDRERNLKDWFQRGIVHVLGSDGHSPRRRRPLMKEAYQRIIMWAGQAVADRVCSTNGMAILHGLPLKVPEPKPRRKRWFFAFG